ncbi:MAG TPA: GNAT family N-acetyltransferase [Candidatus Saccharimonadales bacterium]|nr:GNAT family N-acetyltransferase [Candidatus Saccharimonadales bacterium]
MTATAELTYRPVAVDELAACADVWRHGINDYIRRLNQADVPEEVGPLIRLYTHLQATDPERFVVGTVPREEVGGAGGAGEAGERIVAFAAAVQREHLWFLSMCFVLPEFQRSGVGRALLDHVLPPDGDETVRGTATDSAQPVSNALYASLGIVPRVPLLNLIGLPARPEAFDPLPTGVQPVPFEDLAGPGTGGDGHRRLAETVDAIDREVLGVAHPVDHRFLRQEGRRGWMYHGPDGSPIGYGYASEAGRVGPVAVLDGALLSAALGHLTSAVIPRGAFALWLPGTADRAVVPALRAGFRLDQFPILLCWDRPFADLTRYLPISPGLL